MAPWARILGAGRPAELSPPHALKGHRRDYMLDHIAGKYDFVAARGDHVPDNEVVREVLAGCRIAADRIQRVSSHYDGWPQPKLDAFQQVRGENTGGHFHAHPHGIQQRPDTPRVEA